MTDEQKIAEGYRLLNSVNDYVLKCFTVSWHWIPSRVSMGDRRLVENLLKEYGQETVRDAFLEARAGGVDKENLRYVRACCKGIHEDKSKKKFIEKHEEAKKEDTQTWNPKEDDEWVKVVKELGATKVWEAETKINSGFRNRLQNIQEQK